LPDISHAVAGARRQRQPENTKGDTMSWASLRVRNVLVRALILSVALATTKTFSAPDIRSQLNQARWIDAEAIRKTGDTRDQLLETASASNGIELSPGICDSDAVQKRTTAPAPALAATGERAQMSDSFVDTIGVNTHFGWAGTVYYDGFTSIVAPAIAKSGIRHFRDAGYATLNWQSHRFIDLANYVKTATGTDIKFTLIVDAYGCDFSDARPPTYLPAANITTFEGLNEHDNAYVGHACSWNRTSWSDEVRSHQQALFNAVKANPSFTAAGIKVAGPSIVQGTKSAQVVGNISAYMDVGSMHSYPGNSAPTNAGQQRSILTPMNGNKATLATETGYHNMPQTSSKFRGVSEAASGKYIPRLLLNYFMAGVPRTFLYEFIDNSVMDDIEAHFGLMRRDGSEKPAFTAIKNMIGVLKDPGASFTTGSLNYSISGNMRSVKKLLLQKRDGRFFLILWQEVASYNGSNNTDISVPDRSLTVNLAGAAQSVKVYRPRDSETPTDSYTSRQQFPVAVPDHPVIIEIVP
jgi:hypothetical protein